MFTAVVVYLCVPLFIFLFTFLDIWFTTAAAALLVVLICYMWHMRQQSTPQPALRRYWLMLLLVASIIYTGIWSPFNYWDWQKHFSIFNFLIEQPWPPLLELDGEPHFLRYGLGWYLIPALIANIIGTAALTPTMYLWTLLGVCMALLLALRDLGTRAWWHLPLATIVFFFFSGLDLIGAWYTQYLTSPNPHWLQWWVEWGQISPNLFGATWVPQHALPAWLGAALVLSERRLLVQHGALLLTAVLLWSPFAAIGLAPLFLYALCREGLRAAWTVPNLAVAPLLLIPLLLYFSSDTGHLPFTFAASVTTVTSLILFMLLEFGIALLLLFLLRDRYTDKGLLLTCGLTLIALTLVRFGAHNDMLMRASIAPICILAVFSSQALLRQSVRTSTSAIRVVFMIYLLIAAVPVIIAYAQSVNPRTPRVAKNYRFTSKSTETKPELRYQYLARLSQGEFYLRKLNKATAKNH